MMHFRPLCMLLILLGSCLPLRSLAFSRFFYSGDGRLQIEGQTWVFRDAKGNYREAGLRPIHRLLGASWDPPEERLSLRLIEMLDYLQEQLHGGSYGLKSGYRSPELNQSLRRQGKLAAQSSMHLEGAAADLILEKVPSLRVFNYVKSLDCCGIGFYHGKHFHLDTGPSRYWDEKTSKTEEAAPQKNAKVILQSDYDRYAAGETVALKLMRVTEYPLNLASQAELWRAGQPQKKTALPLGSALAKSQNGQTCLRVPERRYARSLSVKLPARLEPGLYTLRVQFCERNPDHRMPESIDSRPFEVVD